MACAWPLLSILFSFSSSNFYIFSKIEYKSQQIKCFQLENIKTSWKTALILVVEMGHFKVTVMFTERLATWQAEKYSSHSELSAGHYSFAAKTIFTQWNMKVVLLSYTVLVQLNFIPVELCLCRKDLQLGAISNHSDWGTFSELKYNLSYIFFKTISIPRILNNCFIVCPKHTYRCDLVFMYEWRENASFSVRKWWPRPRSRDEIAYFKVPSILRKIKRCWTFQCINRK